MAQLAVEAIPKKPDNTGSVVGGILGAIAAAAATFLTMGAAAPAAPEIAGGGAALGADVGAAAGAGGASAATAGGLIGGGAAAGVDGGTAVAAGGAGILDTAKTVIGNTEFGQGVGGKLGAVMDKPGSMPNGPQVDTSAAERRMQQAQTPPFDVNQSSSILADSLKSLQSAPQSLQEAYLPSLKKAYVSALSQDYDRNQQGGQS